MKKILSILAITAFLFAACAEGNKPAEETTKTQEAEAPAIDRKAEALAGRLDPVCDMTYDESWTDSTSYEGSTVHFCSTACKEAFEGNPERYLGSK